MFYNTVTKVTQNTIIVHFKCRDREERLAILNAQHEQQKQELKKKIEQKVSYTNDSAGI